MNKLTGFFGGGATLFVVFVGCCFGGVQGSETIPAAYPKTGCGYSGIVRFQVGAKFFVGEVLVGAWLRVEPLGPCVDDGVLT